MLTKTIANKNIAYVVGHVEDESKNVAIVVIAKPTLDIVRGISALQRKLKTILIQNNNYGSFYIHFLSPIVNRAESEASEHVMIRNLKLYEDSINKKANKNGVNTDVIVAWGNKGCENLMYIPCLYLATKSKARVLCFGMTAEGAPKDPTYVRINQMLLPYESIE
jgi:hypothetical protein